ncbi:MAG: chorismate synthase [Limnochordia bacterium]|jgi:chorismate synthase
MLRYLDAGESHGQGLMAVVEGMPAGVPLQAEKINVDLRRRQGGYGRGGRMKIERDQVKILSGIRGGLTLGSPIGLLIENRDWANWQGLFDPSPGKTWEPLSRPRPGHADLAGGLKYGQRDLRNILERASARGTAVRVAVGAVAKALLAQFDIQIASHVLSIGGVMALPPSSKEDILGADQSPVRCVDPKASQEMMGAIDETRKAGESLGGTFEVIAWGVPVGLGSHVHWDRRLDGRLAAAMMSIQGIKGVELGRGFEAAFLMGSQVHDEIHYDRGYLRRTNNAGGVEGGISNGEPIVVRAAMKPIPTLYRPLKSVDMLSKERVEASIERSDICAVPAAAIVGEAATAWVLAQSFLEKFGGDSLDEIKRNYRGYLKEVADR